MKSNQGELFGPKRSGKTYEMCKRLFVQRTEKLLNLIGNKTNCKACGRTIWFVKLNSGRIAPFTDEGENHFADCPSAGEFRKR